MLAYVISDGIRSSFTSTFLQLSGQKLTLIVEPAVFIGEDEYRQISHQSREFHKSLYGRALTIGEVGCALAHENVYRDFLERSEDWCLVLEDDAQIADVPRFVSRALSIFPVLDSNKPIIVSMFFQNFTVGKFAKRGPIGGTYWSKLAPYGAVAYLVNRLAAERILRAQSENRHQADWPVTARDVKFLLDFSKMVTHPQSDGAKQSLIGVRHQREEVSLLIQRVKYYAGTRWGLQHGNFSNFPNYWRWHLFPGLVRLWYSTIHKNV